MISSKTNAAGIMLWLTCAIAAMTLRPAEAQSPASRGSDAATHISGPWLKVYALEPYSQYWHVRLRVTRTSQALPKILKALKKTGGESALPLANMAASLSRGYQQLSYRFSVQNAGAAIEKLRKLGTMEVLVQTPASSWDPGALQESQSKLKELKAEMGANQDVLKRMPAVQALASELEDHLTRAEATYKMAKDRVLLNIEILQQPDQPEVRPGDKKQ